MSPVSTKAYAPLNTGECLALFAIALVSLALVATELPRALPGQGLRDFGSFFASGKAAAEGLNPYGIYPLTFHVVLPGFESWNPNLNPPISALLFQLFTLTDPHVSFRVWWGISLVLYLAAATMLVARYGEGLEAIPLFLWCFGLTGVWDTLWLGQIYTPLVLCTAGAWLLLERGQNVSAGLLIGIVVALKPNFLVWPALLLLSRHYRVALVSGATAGLISLVPVGAFGPEIYRQWFELLVYDGNRIAFPTNASLAGGAARAGVPVLGLFLSLGLLLALAAWATSRRPSPIRASEMALLAAVLASPIGWVHYTLFLLPILLTRWRQPPMWASALVLMVPAPFIIGTTTQSAAVQLTIGSAYGWAVLLCLITSCARRPERLSISPDVAAAARSSRSALIQPSGRAT